MNAEHKRQLTYLGGRVAEVLNVLLSVIVLRQGKALARYRLCDASLILTTNNQRMVVFVFWFL